MTQEPQQPADAPEDRPTPRWGQYAPVPPGNQDQVRPPGNRDGWPAPPVDQPPTWQQPGWGQQQPGWGQQQPGWGQQQPGWGQQQGWGQQPGWGRGYVAPPKPGVIPLRPLNVGEVLDGAFQAARRNPKAMFGSALLVQAFSAVLTAVVLLIVLGSGASAFLAADDAQDFEGLGGLVVTMMAGVLVAAVLQAIATMILQGVLVVPVVRSVLNGKTGFRQMWRLARPRLGTLTILALLYAAALMAVFALLALSAWGLITILGLGGAALAVLMLLAVFALFLWLGVKLLLAPAVVILEDLPLGAALRRSWQLTTGQWWRTFGTAVLAQIIAGVVGAVIAVPVSFAANIIAALVNPTPTEQEQIVQVVVVQAVALIVNTLIGGITLAFQSGVLALIAMDLKMRKDGFDVALMKEQENVPADAVDYLPGLPGGLHGGRVERPVS